MTSLDGDRGFLVSRDDLKRPRLLVLACAIGMAVSTTPIFWSTFSTFITPLQKEFGWSRSALSTLFTIEGSGLIVGMYLFGPLAQRFGSRRVIASSAALLAAALLGLSLSHPSYSAVAFWMAMVGVAGAGTHVFAYLALLPQWFSQRLGLIFALAMSGSGLGQLLTPIIAQQVTAASDWRTAYAVLAGVVALVSVPNALFLLKENPRFNAPRTLDNLPRVAGLTFGETLRTPTFWLLTSGFSLVCLILGGGMIHLAPMLMSHGYSPAAAASLVGLCGASSLVFRPIGGYLLDRVGPFAIATLAFVAAGLGMVCVLPGVDPRLAVLAPLLMGLALGVEGDVLPYITRQFFGMKAYALTYSRLLAATMIGAVFGATVMGFLFDLSGDYEFGLLVFAGMTVLSVALLWLGMWSWPPSRRFEAAAATTAAGPAP